MLNTIGYEGADLADFLTTLNMAKVDILIDVRDRAQSRKRGFSKTALSEALLENGIEYLHLKELGDPKEGREAARSGNFMKFEKIYLGVLKSEVAQAAIDVIEKIVESKNACLLCYERDHRTCHRKYISDDIDARRKLKTRHLGVRKYEKVA
ncbi:MAG: hypothetical protein COA69_09825 [Robiginitomaculum sp.]|nr:MAG: hypothetical protein COA69_09825 [Robiginitomaculum sp.]